MGSPTVLVRISELESTLFLSSKRMKTPTAHDYDDPSIADTFQRLNSRDHAPNLTQRGLWASWAALVLFAACMVGVAMIVIDADRRAEEIRLRQSADLIVSSLESRLLGTAEILQKTSMRLSLTGKLGHPLASAELSAYTLMDERREVSEITLVGKDGTVLQSWGSNIPPAKRRYETGAKLPERTVAPVQNVIANDASAITRLYTLPDTNLVFADLIVPTPDPQQALVARVDLMRLLNEIIRYSTSEHYHFEFVADGRPILPETTDAANRAPGSAIVYEAPITFLGKASSVRTALRSTSYEHALFTTNRLPLLAVAGLLVMLAFSIGMIFHYQRRQHRSHRQLLAEYSLRRTMSESAIVGLRVTDANGRILYVNETFQRIMGWSAEELINQRPPYTYWTEEMEERFTEPRLIAQATEPITFTAKRKSGERFHAEMRLSPLCDEKGRRLGFIGALYDVTAQVRAREQMQAANERFIRVVQSMYSAIAVLSNDRTQVLFANRSYERLFGNKTEGAVRLLEGESKLPASQHREGVYDEPTGRWFEVRSQQLSWASGEAVLMLIATDITDRRELEIAREAQLRRAESTQRLVTMGEMASSLAHELNQPLAAISNYAGGASTMMENGTLTNERALTAFKKIENQALRCGKIIQRIRGFAKKTDPHLEEVDVTTVIHEAMELAVIQARKYGAEIRLDVPEDLPVMRADAVLLEQLLLNLVKNGMEAAHASADRTITVRVRNLRNEQANVLRFEVEDHGPGISDEEKERLFDAFYTTKTEGMGMGLNICRSIVELHGGRLSVEDTPGGGATFVFTVPTAPEATTSSEADL